ncbi:MULTISPECIES: hypothetical protein [unclassified Nostoc]|nr:MULTISPECIES: hypothetical protein [unclassified Nostoc]MDM9585173.1 hypothetical protein [Nostoc sp. GT001]MDZ7944856.1 hypothetical protein [Nostoc sp. EfeVER01]MDZ7994051.1 hypothetical protein [Nostoc sp. EspVER01]
MGLNPWRNRRCGVWTAIAVMVFYLSYQRSPPVGSRLRPQGVLW